MNQVLTVGRSSPEQSRRLRWLSAVSLAQLFESFVTPGSAPAGPARASLLSECLFARQPLRPDILLFPTSGLLGPC